MGGRSPWSGGCPGGGEPGFESQPPPRPGLRRGRKLGLELRGRRMRTDRLQVSGSRRIPNHVCFASECSVTRACKTQMLLSCQFVLLLHRITASGLIVSDSPAEFIQPEKLTPQPSVGPERFRVRVCRTRHSDRELQVNYAKSRLDPKAAAVRTRNWKLTRPGRVLEKCF